MCVQQENKTDKAAIMPKNTRLEEDQAFAHQLRRFDAPPPAALWVTVVVPLALCIATATLQQPST